jgi:hypothetical protein
MVLEGREAHGRFILVPSLKDEIRVRNSVMSIALDKGYDTACERSVLVRLVERLDEFVHCFLLRY